MPVLPLPTSLMMTYLPIFSGKAARPFADFACWGRMLVKGNRALLRDNCAMRKGYWGTRGQTVIWVEAQRKWS